MFLAAAFRPLQPPLLEPASAATLQFQLMLKLASQAEPQPAPLAAGRQPATLNGRQATAATLTLKYARM